MSLRITMLAASLALAVGACGGGEPAIAREQIQIVGSSTVFPFATAVAEEFGQKNPNLQTPVVESTGTGGGIKLFCGGVGDAYPDIANASRRMKQSELDECTANGVTPVEIRIGFDGIAVANSKASPVFTLSRKEIFLALAAQVPDASGARIPNPNQTWNQIRADLPATKIEVLGPPPTSGTRDAFVELVMEAGAKEFPALAALSGDEFKAAAHTIREDGAYVEAGENDNLIVQKLVSNPSALGVFGYSFLEQNMDKIQGSVIEGVAPSFEAIADGSYSIARSLYFYVKKEHVAAVPGIEDYIAEFVSDAAIGPDGYLLDKGLIPLPEADRAGVRESSKKLQPVSL